MEIKCYVRSSIDETIVVKRNWNKAIVLPPIQKKNSKCLSRIMYHVPLTQANATIGDNRPFLSSFKYGCAYLVCFIYINNGCACCVAIHAYLIVHFRCASAGFLIKVLCLNAVIVYHLHVYGSIGVHTCADLFTCIAAWNNIICIYLLWARLE